MIDKQKTNNMTDSKIKRTKEGKAYLVTTTQLNTNLHGEIEWQLSFSCGGWNTVWAKTYKKAQKVAKQEFPDFTITSIFPATKESLKVAMMNFY